ncbi:MAG: phosphoenolpyruvate mutase [Gammaproteobacteria bacterium]|nr:phosphoenolpyruvate mutase [Gammaproteobacteria bacterium]
MRHDRRATDKKTVKFRNLLQSDQLEFICEAHNGLSAKICEEAGFKGIWASGLCLSAQFGVRDSNEASWTQLMEMLEFMSDATSIPIMLDGDTGYGNFNNMRRLVTKLEQRDIAAVCIEDKLFPKTNSFIHSREHPLADIDEFCGKIKAAKDAQKCDSFSVVARIESLIAGWGMDEALRRAEAYHAAGADAILIHSAKSKADEVLSFKKEWGDRGPVVIVPTKYYSTPTDVFREHRFSMVIWANHILRSAVSAMQSTARRIQEEECLHSIEDSIASVGEVFRLQGAQELQAAEARYLPVSAQKTRAIVLAAARGSDMGELTADRPKAMITVRNKSLLSHIVDAYNAAGISQLNVVRGYCKDAVDLPNINLVDNDDYADTGELYSLHLALNAVTGKGDTVISYGDVLFRKYILDAVLEADDDFVIAVDAAWRETANRDRSADYVACSMPNTRNAFYRSVTLEKMDNDIESPHIHGEWMGILKVSEAAYERFTAIVREIVHSPQAPGRAADMPHLCNELIRRGHSIRVIYSTGNWLDVDTVEDVVASSSFQ